MQFLTGAYQVKMKCTVNPKLSLLIPVNLIIIICIIIILLIDVNRKCPVPQSNRKLVRKAMNCVLFEIMLQVLPLLLHHIFTLKQ